jgi:hypothetical protein
VYGAPRFKPANAVANFSAVAALADIAENIAAEVAAGIALRSTPTTLGDIAISTGAALVAAISTSTETAVETGCCVTSDDSCNVISAGLKIARGR